MDPTREIIRAQEHVKGSQWKEGRERKREGGPEQNREKENNAGGGRGTKGVDIVAGGPPARGLSANCSDGGQRSISAGAICGNSDWRQDHIERKKSRNIWSGTVEPFQSAAHQRSGWNSFRWHPVHCLGISVPFSQRTASLENLCDVCYGCATFGSIGGYPRESGSYGGYGFLHSYPDGCSVHLRPTRIACTSLYVAEVTSTWSIPHSGLDSFHTAHLVPFAIFFSMYTRFV